MTSSASISNHDLRVGITGLIGFCLVCSGNYILNDVFDKEKDKESDYKKELSIAKGDIPLKNAVVFSLSILVLGFIVCSTVSLIFLTYAFCYFLVAVTYSLRIKSQPSLQVIVLVIFYQFRIFLGGELFRIPISFWLILFSFSIFSCLAFLKIYAKRIDAKVNHAHSGKDYELAYVSQFGISFGISSLLTLAFYINSPEVALVYSQPKVLWIMIPMLQFMILHLWKQTLEKKMHYDPIIFILRDHRSRVTLFTIFLVLALGRILK